MNRTLAIAAALLSLAQAAAAQTAPAPASSPPQAPAAPAEPAAPPTEAAPPATAPATPPAEPAPAVTPPPPPPAAEAVTTPPPASPPPAEPKPSRRRNLYTWGSAGTTFAYGETYASVNLGVGWMMRAGITPNVEVSYAFGSSPTLWALRPGVTWFAPIPLSPYVGAYYTRWLVNDLPDENGVGGRAGISLGRVLSIGVTYDRALDCDRDCDSWSPQISAGLSL